MKTFHIELTKQQTESIRNEWTEHGQAGGLMLAQADISFGPFQAKRGTLMCAIVDAGQREKIQAILKI